MSRLTFRISAFLLPFCLTSIFFSVPQFEGEFNGAFKYAKSYFSDPELFIKTRSQSLSGTEERLIMWTASCQEIFEHPFGVGTGNVDEYLHKRLIKYGLFSLAKKNYNPHNQFFQIMLEVGIIGFLIFISIFVLLLYQSFKLKNELFLILAINLIFNSLFESMLQRQSGIVFYSFWIGILILIFCRNKMKSNEITNSDTILST